MDDDDTMYWECCVCGTITDDPYVTKTGRTMCWDCFNLVE